MGTNPQDGVVPEYFPTQGRVMDHWEADKKTGGWELGVPIIGGSNCGSRPRGDRNIHHEEAEHGRTVYCNAADYRLL